MKDDTAIIICDAHLGQAPGDSETLLHRFLETIPDRASHLIINGDLFEFWFEYRHVIPRRAFRTLSLLDRIRDAGVRLTVFGGNHDRWGGDFWSGEMDAEFHRSGAEIEIAGWKAFVAHGDGLLEKELGGKWIHRITGWAATEKTFRAIHPDLGFRIVRRLSGRLADAVRTEEELDQLAAIQTAFARELFERRSDLELVVLGHTHRAVLAGMGPRKSFVNPGAWFDGGSYAEVSRDECKLFKFSEL